MTALAGTLSAADRTGAQHAVMTLHEFLTDQRPHDKIAANDAKLLPEGPSAPWCVEVPALEGIEAKTYVARAVTDLRASTLSARAAAELDAGP